MTKGHIHTSALLAAWLCLQTTPSLSQDISDLSYATPANPVDATFLLTNPSFESGDESGWTVIGRDPAGNAEFAARNYGMSGKHGTYLMNAYQWWAPTLAVVQTATGLPSGDYELSAMVCTWEGRTVTLAANGNAVTTAGRGDQTGIPVNIPFTIDANQRLIIRCQSTAQWWLPGHEGETQTFFKLDNLRLTCLKSQAYHTEARGTLRVCALNVDGLPQSVAFYSLNPDGPGRDGTLKISSYLASKGYDIIGASEDFNYHGSLMSALQPSYASGTVRSTLSVEGLAGGLPFDTDGLNAIWRTAAVAATGESWTHWQTTEATDGNQYVRKGYRHYDITTADGTSFDLFVLHMDAGSTDAAIASRHAQWRQLADAVNATGTTRPKLIIGDTNSRWTREDIAANFTQRLSNALRMTDAWVELCRDGIHPTTDMDDLTDRSVPTDFSLYEVVDKVICINPVAIEGTTQLIPNAFCIEQDYTYGQTDGTADTKPLGDHPPVVVSLTYKRLGRMVPTAIDDGLTRHDTNATATPEAWHTIDGQRMEQKPARKGIYLHTTVTGIKKVLIK